MRTELIIKNIGVFLRRNAPQIAIGCGIIGFAVTNYLTAKATNDIRNEMDEIPMTKKEENICKIRHYILPAITGTLSAGLVLTGERKFENIQAGLIAAYAALDRKNKEYQKAVAERLSPEQLAELNHYTPDHMDIPSPAPNHIEIYDEWTQQFFETTMEELLDAQYQLNRSFALKNRANLNDWIELTGQNYCKDGNVVGWSLCNDLLWLDFEMEYIESDGHYYYNLHYPEPVIDYDRFY